MTGEGTGKIPPSSHGLETGIRETWRLLLFGLHSWQTNQKVKVKQAHHPMLNHATSTKNAPVPTALAQGCQGFQTYTYNE